MISLTTILIILTFSLGIYSAPFEMCPARSSLSDEIKLDVDNCDDNQTICTIVRGGSYNITIHFKPQVTNERKLERLIVAKLEELRNKSIEVPYGLHYPLDDLIFLSDDTPLGNRTLEAGETYYHTSTFKIPSVAPATKIKVIYIIRENQPCRLPSRCSYRLHNGNMFLCIEIPIILI